MEKCERCPWCLGNEIYEKYHDEEWGVPSRDDGKQFEFLVLESAQAGLSWLTILRKRENYRRAYGGFDPEVVAAYGDEDVSRLMADAGIVRNRRKIEASIENAKRFLEIRKEYGSFSKYIWKFVDDRPIVGRRKSLQEIPPSTPLSDRIAGDLKMRGFKFLGSVIVYSHLQATGLVNDHLMTCFRYGEILKGNG